MSISVVIPAFDGSRFIAETLQSVHEILVIDDGSTDDTAAIAESFVPLCKSSEGKTPERRPRPKTRLHPVARSS